MKVNNLQMPYRLTKEENEPSLSLFKDSREKTFNSLFKSAPMSGNLNMSGTSFKIPHAPPQPQDNQPASDFEICFKNNEKH